MRRHLRATLCGAGLLIAMATLLIALINGMHPVIIALVLVWGAGFGAVPVAAQTWMARTMPASVEGVWPCSSPRFKVPWPPGQRSAASFSTATARPVHWLWLLSRPRAARSCSSAEAQGQSTYAPAARSSTQIEGAELDQPQNAPVRNIILGLKREGRL